MSYNNNSVPLYSSPVNLNSTYKYPKFVDQKPYYEDNQNVVSKYPIFHNKQNQQSIENQKLNNLDNQNKHLNYPIFPDRQQVNSNPISPNNPNNKSNEEQKTDYIIQKDDSMFMKSMYLAGSVSSTIRSVHYKTNHINKKDIIIEESDQDPNSQIEKAIKRENFEINDLKQHDLVKSVVETNLPLKRYGLQVSCLPFKEETEKKKGFLLKKAPLGIKGWEKRYCKIKNRMFLYYMPKDKKKAVGCIDFDIIKVTLEEVSFIKYYNFYYF